MEKDSTRNDHDKLSPLLSKLRSENAFHTPEGYFDSLPEQIMERVVQKPAKGFARVLPQKILRPAILAVGVVFFAVISLIMLHTGSENGYFTASDEAFFNDYLSWYSDYQTDAFYDIILADDIGMDEEFYADEYFGDDDMIDYMMMYGDYYMDLPPADEGDLW